MLSQACLSDPGLKEQLVNSLAELVQCTGEQLDGDDGDDAAWPAAEMAPEAYRAFTTETAPEARVHGGSGSLWGPAKEVGGTQFFDLAADDYRGYRGGLREPYDDHRGDSFRDPDRGFNPWAAPSAAA